MRAGAFNENISILRSCKQRDEYGIDKDEWKEFARTKAAVKYLSGSRTVDVQELFFDERVEFIIRYYHRVQPTDRI